MNNKISWTDATWSPVTGCDPISPGCANCWAKRMSHRLAGRYGYPAAPNQFDVTLHPDRLDQPLRWRKPRRVFVCSMSDLFHKDVPFEYIYLVFETMRKSPQHTFQVLTKRPARMAELIENYRYKRLMETGPPDRRAPDLSNNIHLGVTAEDQQRADERIPVLLEIPAAFHYVSLEPLLGPINLFGDGSDEQDWTCNGPDCKRPHIGLAIVGGETGPGARPMHPAWPRSLRDQCAAAGVTFHFKSWGEWVEFSPDDHGDIMPKHRPSGEISNFIFMAENGDKDPLLKKEVTTTMVRVGAKAAGHLLDGVEHRGLPE